MTDFDKFYVVSSDGATSFLFDGDQPKWSPDGKQIVFSVWDATGNKTSIWIMDADGENKKEIVKSGWSAVFIPK